MPKWTFDVKVTGSMTVAIHADTEEEAREILDSGEYEPSAELCVQCSGYTTEVNKFPGRFSLDLDEFEVPDDLDQFTREED
ncbi:hypothetical protein GCM10010399_63880 [Dactylosporangium fulvum]|uniref:Uncharacterized protein n=1 Tax=Dactylosporangium fulvum TaxID=53359 RepID=A0ABY5W994_9ACTN|nr:hypothetical protein [Dactylosporangium fulvum]UWP85789.1 hypothetical protein Dfulv_16715 [Dactylosporangium fulvum]